VSADRKVARNPLQLLHSTVRGHLKKRKMNRFAIIIFGLLIQLSCYSQTRISKEPQIDFLKMGNLAEAKVEVL